MARMRYIKPEFWTDRAMVGLSLGARLLYIGTWNFALCDKGHLEDDAFRLKMQIFPADNIDVEAALAELMAAGRIVRLESTDGSTYLCIVHLKDHQKVDPRWTPRCAACKDAANLSETLQSPPELSGTLPNSPQEGRGGEGIGEEGIGGVTHSAPAAPKRPSEPAGFIDFWAAYPKRADKGHARTAYATAARTASVEDILAGAQRLADDPNLPEAKFIPNASTWLRGERWDDGPLPSRNGRPVDKQADLLRSEMVKAQAADALTQRRGIEQ